MGSQSKMLSSCLILALALPAMSQDCPDMQPTTCMEGDIICDMGMNGDCWNGDYCMPEGSECPVACYTPDPAMCEGSDMVCDNGMDENGCWLGNYCMPSTDGAVCP